MQAGEKILYEIKVTNTSNIDANNIKIIDEIPEGTTLFSIGQEGIENNGKITWNIDIKANYTKIVRFTVIVNEDAKGDIKNVASVDGENTNETINPIIKTLKQSKVIKNGVETSKTAKVGDTIRYTIIVENTGNIDGKVKIQDNIPKNTKLVENSISNNGTLENETITWEDVEVKANSKTEVSFEVTINEDAKESILNHALVGNTNTNETENKIANIVAIKQSLPGKEEVLHEKDKITYNITLKNIGNETGKVTIEDTVPKGTTLVKNSVKIDGKNQGTIKIKDRLITWEDVEVEVGKNVVLSFEVTIDCFEEGVTDKIIVNNQAKIDGKPINETENPATKVYTTIEAKKIWQDYDNKNGYRPESIILQLKNGNKVVQEKEISGTENIWNVTFENVPKYDQIGAEINYTIDEKEVNENDLSLYIKTIENTTITNTLREPKIVANKTSKTSTGLKAVTIGDTITYTITITNEGTLYKDVNVKDTIPEHTVLVGDIKLDNKKLTSKEQEKLQEGTYIIRVEEKQTRTLTFKVKVTSGNPGQIVTNTAYVDGTPVGPVENPIEKIIGVTKYKNNIASTNIVLVLDVSSSMTRYPDSEKNAPVGKRRIDIAKKALVNFIEETYKIEENKDVTFTLITFSRREYTELFKFNGGNWIATKDNKDQFISAINNIQTKQGTNMRAGLEYAYDALYGTNGLSKMPKYKDYNRMLIFFGDGEPYTEENLKNNAQGILEEANLIRSKGTKIYSIGFGPDTTKGETGYDRLSDIANGGKVYNSQNYEQLIDNFSEIVSADPTYEQITVKGNAIIELTETAQTIIVDEKNPITINVDGTKIKITNEEEARKNNITYTNNKIVWDVSGYPEAAKLNISYYVE